MARANSQSADESQAVIVTNGLSKYYGPFAALEDCSFSVGSQEIYGLLGPNGAGKTTLLRLLLGFLHASRGTARVNGWDCFRDGLAIRRFTAYLPGDARLFRGMRGRDVIAFFARLRGQDGSSARRVADRLELNLATRVGAMSTGMRQKLALTITFAADCRLLVLDEPTSNLDPTARSIVLDLAREAREQGSTVVFSSHVLSEVEEISDHVAILRTGRLVHVQNMPDLRRQHRITAELEGDLPQPPSQLADRLQIRRHEAQRVVMEASGELAAVLAWLSTLPLRELRIDPAGLRAVYDRYHRSPAAADSPTTSGPASVPS
jgi:ABC-2 type transport system ATP-binding protein